MAPPPDYPPDLLPSPPPRRYPVLGWLATVAIVVASAWGRAHPPKPVVVPLPERAPPAEPPEPILPRARVAAASAQPALPPLAEDGDAAKVADLLDAAYGRLAQAGREPGAVFQAVDEVRVKLGTLDRPLARLRESGEPGRRALAVGAETARSGLLRGATALQAAARTTLESTGEKGLHDPFSRAERAVAGVGPAVREVVRAAQGQP